MANWDWKLSKDVELRVMIENIKIEHNESEEQEILRSHEPVEIAVTSAVTDKLRIDAEFQEDMYLLVSHCQRDCEHCMKLMQKLSHHIKAFHENVNSHKIPATKKIGRPRKPKPETNTGIANVEFLPGKAHTKSTSQYDDINEKFKPSCASRSSKKSKVVSKIPTDPFRESDEEYFSNFLEEQECLEKEEDYKNAIELNANALEHSENENNQSSSHCIQNHVVHTEPEFKSKTQSEYREKKAKHKNLRKPSGGVNSTDVKPTICEICNLALKPGLNLKHHEKYFCKGKTSQTLACNICRKIFANDKTLTKHLRRTHANEIAKPCACSYCELKFFTATKLNRHMTEVHPDKPLHVCKTCQKSYPSNARLLLHIRTHNGEKPCKCPMCPKSFTKTELLNRHLRIHLGTKLHKCQICANSFSSLGALRVHERRHTGEKPFLCDVCSKCFASQLVLTTHLKIHSEEGGVKIKPYKCNKCEKSFLRKDHLTTHEFSHGEKQCLCQTCGKSFTLPHQLKQHVKNQHTME